MTTTAGLLLVNQILPLIMAAIAKGAVKPTGCEDFQELQAEGCALAAAILDSAEARGKAVTPGNVAFYAVQALKSGRRSNGAGRGDAMSAAAALDGKVQVQSLDASIGFDENDPDHEMTLHDLLAAGGEDTDVAAARELDWNEVLPRLDERRRAVLRETLAGYGPNEMAAMHNVAAPRIVQLRQSCSAEIMDAWGNDGLAEITTASKWRAGLRAAAERRAGRYERARK